MSSRPTVSIVIPAYNESGRLPASLAKLQQYAETRPQVAEIIVVDDGSSDATATTVRDFARNNSHFRLVSYGPNGGKGYAIRRGVLEAKADRILISDADLSTPIEELSKLEAALSGADIAIGSRGIDESTVKLKQHWVRQHMGKIFNRLMRSLTGLSYVDTQCGFKLLPQPVARKIFAEATIDRFAYDVEMLMLAHRHGYSVAEVPVLWFNSPDSRVHLIRDSFRMLFDVLALRRRLGRAFPPKSSR